MATYADFTAQTMASNDFTLYPYQEPWNNDQTYLPTTGFDQAYLDTTSFDSFQVQQSYLAAGQDQFPYNTESFQQTKNNLHGPSPSYSPANSASHSFDYQNPPILSSTSDSGASVQSTISSAMGSPSVPPQVSNDWNQQAAMNMLPGIVHHDNIGAPDIFTTSGFDLETIPVTDKGCVGEFTNVSSQQLQNAASLNLSSAPSSFNHSRRAGSAAAESWALPVPPKQHISIPSPAQSAESNKAGSTSPTESFFKSPTTPASATSPVLERVMGKRRRSSALPTPKRAHGSSPLATSTSYTELDVPTRPSAPLPTFSSPFFSQSSGHFVPPLESSCPSPPQFRISCSLQQSLRSGMRALTNAPDTDPSLIQPFSPTQFAGGQFPDMPAAQSPQPIAYPAAPSPTSSQKQPVQSPRQSNGKAPSPYVRAQSWQPYPAYPGSRRQSISSVHSRHSQGSHSSDDSNKGLCPIPTCGRHVKDLKAHMLTHQNERPEKCPIPTCEYHVKGFARKYDKNRHTLTHYKGTMVCGFCPGSGSAAEKSFNRADVFKRHLTSVHGVEQTPPNARRKSPAAVPNKRIFGSREVSGMCSTCGVTFANAQDFYEHLDDCVLRVVQQADPSEAINEKLLSSVAEDKQVQATMERHMLPTSIDIAGPTNFDEEEDLEEEEDGEEDDANDGTYGSRSGKSGKGSIKSRKAAGAVSS
jgi:hypothetical protein